MVLRVALEDYVKMSACVCFVPEDWNEISISNV